MRDAKVDGFMPSSSAAPPGPRDLSVGLLQSVYDGLALLPL